MKRRFLTLMLLGLLLIWDLGGWKTYVSAQPTQTPYQLEKLGEIAYGQGEWSTAVTQWSEALESYEARQNSTDQVRILGKLALVYGKLGNWGLVEQAIADASSLFTQVSDPQTMAQFYNNWGNIALMKGKGENALRYWQEAENLYNKGQDEQGILISQINQAKALKSQGKFRFSCQKLLKALDFDEEDCDNLTLQTLDRQLEKIAFPLGGSELEGWSTLADILRKLGKFNQSLTIIASIQPFVTSASMQSQLWLSVGKTLQLQGEEEIAAEAYQKTLNEEYTPFVQLEAELLQLNLWLSENPPQIETAIAMIPQIESQLTRLPPSQSQLETTFNYISQLIRLKSLDINSNNLPSWEAMATLMNKTLTQAKSLDNQRSIAYGLGLLGNIREKQQQWIIATDLTRQALVIAESLNAPEMTYLWNWQLGRIFKQQQKRDAAIKAYRRAITTHRQISGEIAANREAQFSFQETGERLYREAVSLLLQPNTQGKPSQEELIEARQVMESLQIATLNNFFRDNCLEDAQEINLEPNLDNNTAILYPIILSDRLGVILNLPEQPLYYYETKVSEQELKQTLDEFRYTVVIRSRWDFLTSGAKLYNWLMKPAEDILEKNGIKTLVFVPDGRFRNIPLAALVSDTINRHYLIEKYRVSLTPSLSLFPNDQTSLQPPSLLLGGITEENLGTSPLPYVGIEINNIEPLISDQSIILKNEDLNFPNLETAFRHTTLPIVHLATHGLFSSNFEETYILIWQNILNIQQLGNLLELSRLQRDQTIELLVLSACETATGDQRAALGLAGVAVRSGASSTLATLWSVNDQGTAYFMQKFYKNLSDPNKQPYKAEALQLAQVELIDDQWYSHPFYWSPFVLVGNWR
ncbi:MAG: CHAT domain-containing protein [Microcystaceae cyanobacterium]